MIIKNNASDYGLYNNDLFKEREVKNVEEDRTIDLCLHKKIFCFSFRPLTAIQNPAAEKNWEVSKKQRCKAFEQLLLTLKFEETERRKKLGLRKICRTIIKIN
jgi:hypothetical protein